MPAPGVAEQPPVPEGARQYNQLIASGFSKVDADAWAAQKNQQLLSAGFKPDEIQGYWGSPPVKDGGLVGDMMRHNLAQGQPRIAKSPWDYLEAGWQMSDLGLMLRGKLPDVVNPGGAQEGWGDLAAATVGQMGGDMPFAVGGALGGAKVGAMVPGPPQVKAVASAYGAGAGAAGVPEALRQTLIMSYRRGEVHNWSDFVSMASDGVNSTLKAATVGGLAGLVGGQAGAKVLGKTGSKLLAGTADTGANIATFTTANAGMEGRMPEPKDFTAAAITAMALHGTHTGGEMLYGKFNPNEANLRVQKNLQEIYTETGIPPWEAVAKAKEDPRLMEELIQQDVHGDAVMPSLQEIAGAPQPRPGYKQPALHRPEAPMQIAGLLKTMQALEGSAAAAKVQGVAEQDVVSPKGAVGRFQVMPGTARQYGFDPTRLHEPEYNQQVATHIITDLYKRFDGDTEAVAIAYNAGPGRAAKFLNAGRDRSVLPLETQRYLAHLDKIHGQWHGGGEGAEGDGAPGGAGAEASGPRQAPSWAAVMEGGQEKATEEAKTATDTADMTTDEAHAKLQEMIGEEPKSESLLDPNRLYRQVLSELGPAREIDRSLAEQGYDKTRQMGTEDWFRQTYASDARAGAFVRWGIIDPETRTVIPNSPSFMSAAKTVKDAGGNMKDWQSYMLAQRTMDAAGRGIKTGFDPNAAAQVVSTKSEAAKYEAGTRELNKVLTGALDYAKAKGLYSQDQVSAMVEANPTYISMKRVMDAQRSAGPGKNFRAKDPLSRLEGSDRQIVDPIASTIANLHQIVANADRNEAAGFIVKLAEGKFLGEDIKKVATEPAPVIEQELTEAPLREGMVRMYHGGAPEGSGPLWFTTNKNKATAYALKSTGSDKSVFYIDLPEGHKYVTDPDYPDEQGIKQGFTFEREVDADHADVRQPLYTTKDGNDTVSQAADALAKPSNGSGLKDTQFAYFRDGQREIWEATDPALAKLIRGADSPGEANLITKTFETFAGLQRSGIVAAPDFPVRVMLRHQFQAFIADPHSPMPMITWLRGAADVIGQTQTYKDWVTNGGAGVSLVDMDTKYLQRDFHDLMASTGGWEKAWNTVQHPLEALRLVTERLDAAARTGYFKMATNDKGIEPLKAATLGRTAYLDYSEKGTAAFMQQWSKIVPFFRPHLLGLKQLGDSWSERPVMTSVKMATMVTLPAVTLFALNYLQDQSGQVPEAEQYKNLPRWEKDTMFILPQIGGVRIKIPMPKGIGVPLGGLPIRFLEWAQGQDPHAFDDWAKNWLHDTMPNVIPALASPVLEQATNHSFFSGKPLIPDSLKDLSGDMQYTQATSEPAKALSRVLGSSQGIGVANVSPIVLENYIRGWGGTIGMDALKALNAPLKTSGKPWEVSDIPFVASFVVRHPEMNAQPIQDFYTEYDKFKTAHADFQEAIKRAKSGEPLNMDEINAKGADPRAFVNLANVATALHSQQALIQAIQRDEKMSDNEKRQAGERVYNDMITTAKVGAKAMDDIEHSRNARAPVEQDAPGYGQQAPAAPVSIEQLAGKQ